MKLKYRSSNIELLRILTILGIVFSHFYYSPLYEINYNYTGWGGPELWFMADFISHTITGWGKIGVNIFVIITGYFLCTARFSKIKLFKFIFQCYFWNLFIIFVAVFILQIHPQMRHIIDGLNPLTPNN